MADHMVIDEESNIRSRLGQTNDARPSNNRMAIDSFEPERSEEGWVVIVRGIHEEADEDALTEKFSEFGTIKDVHINLDRRTGYAKGYALIKYETRGEAQIAVDDGNNTKFLGQTIQVEFAFVKPPVSTSRNGGRRSYNRGRSVSPA
ncbi:uncharacterized protein BX664DRAFT_340204 [Halteromyces radiatus]|uniref:uncharacterized protein n=1 Tax=Halteromyces radiatus TaxID=101107 RepID=UPI00221F11FE|nr:uncharacterized protein BX664DRAFT_340204 [Halteromyces radiatus]KAI8081361.1 hypothetical protein BX664DRAFT_340204 [Halteromyces radiatus]